MKIELRKIQKDVMKIRRIFSLASSRHSSVSISVLFSYTVDDIFLVGLYSLCLDETYSTKVLLDCPRK